MSTLKTLLLTAALVAPLSALAAKDPCKGVKIKKDSFGESRIFEAGDLKLKKTEGNWIFTLGINAGGGYGGFASVTNEVLAPGTVVELLMEDDSKIEIATTAPAGSQIFNIMGVVATHYDLPFAVSAEALTTIVAQPIKAYRVMRGGDSWNTGETKKGDAKTFQETGTCMMQSDAG